MLDQGTTDLLTKAYTLAEMKEREHRQQLPCIHSSVRSCGCMYFHQLSAESVAESVGPAERHEIHAEHLALEHIT